MAEDKECHLLGGVFASVVQGFLGLLCISALVIKRQTESPKRDWYVWFLDVMKQGIGSSFGHFSNIFLSVVIATSISSDGSSYSDECQWYCLTYILDSTLGTAFNLVFLSCFERAVRAYPSCDFMEFGVYGDPPKLTIWIPQLGVWLLIVIVGKIIILFCMVQFIVPLNFMISYIFEVFKGKPELELVMVMIIIPTILNTIQFWVTDTFLKRQNVPHSYDSDLDENLIEQDDEQGTIPKRKLSSDQLSQLSLRSTSIDSTRRKIQKHQRRNQRFQNPSSPSSESEGSFETQRLNPQGNLNTNNNSVSWFYNNSGAYLVSFFTRGRSFSGSNARVTGVSNSSNSTPNDSQAKYRVLGKDKELNENNNSPFSIDTGDNDTFL